MPAMGYPGVAQARPAKPPVSGADLAVSIVTLVITLILGVLAAFFGVFSLAFLDHCPPQSCSAEGAVTAVATALLIAAAIGAIGLTATIIALYRRKPGWPFALATLVLSVLTFFLGGVGYAAAVGG